MQILYQCRIDTPRLPWQMSRQDIGLSRLIPLAKSLHVILRYLQSNVTHHLFQ
jgi:hypothetical protein